MRTTCGPCSPVRTLRPHISTELSRDLDSFRAETLDIRDNDGIRSLFDHYRREISLVIHAAAQRSHDWAASDPQTDFTVNANGTLNLLQAARDFTPDATFIYMSTNKVYGDRPNFLPLEEQESRLELATGHPYYAGTRPPCRSTTARIRSSA